MVVPSPKALLRWRRCSIYVFMHIAKSMNQPGKVANPASGQLNSQNEQNISLSPLASEDLVSRDGISRPVPRQPAHSPHSG